MAALWRLILTSLLFIGSAASAGQPWRPLVVASFSGWDKLTAQADFLGELTQNPQLAKTLGDALAARSGVHQLAGLDGSRPWAIIIRTDGLRIHAVAAVPVTDGRRLLQSLSPLIGEPREEAAGVWKIGQRTLTGYVRVSQDWAWLAQTAEALTDLPDVRATLDDLPARYDLAVSLYPAHLPEALRTLGIDEVRHQRDSLLARLIGSPKLPAGELTNWMLESSEEFLTDVQRLTIGCRLDRATKRGVLDVVVEPLAASEVARRWSRTERSPNPLATNRDPAGTSLDLALSTLPRTNYEQLCREQILPLLVNAEEMPESQQRPLAMLCESLGQILNDASRQRPTEALVRASGKSPPYTLLAGLRLDDPELVTRQLERLSGAAAQTPDSPVEVKLDVLRTSALRLHEIHFSGIQDQQVVRRLLGDSATLTIATAGPYVWLACGHRPQAAIEKSQPDATAQPVDAVTLSLRGGAALTAWSRTTTSQDLIPLLTLAALGLQSSDDRISLSARTDAKGLHIKIQSHEGVLRAVALALNLLALQTPRDVTRPVQNP